MILKWALREIRNTFKFSLFFVLNLSIGLIGFLCLDAFKTSLDYSLQQNAKALLTADIAITARKIFTGQELSQAREVLSKDVVEAREWGFLSMAAADKASRFVSVKAVEASYPLYGSLTLEPKGPTAQDLQDTRTVWLYPELMSQLKVSIGDKLRLGNQDYTITATIVDDTSQAFKSASLAPKIYLGLNQIRSSNLISLGTTINDAQLFKLPAGSDAAALVEKLKVKILDPAIQIYDYNENAEDSGKVLKYLSDYLGLVSLVALFLAALGSAYLFRSFIQSRFYQIAIFNSMGLQKSQAQWIYLTQLCFLGMAAAIISIAGASAVLPLLTQVLKSLSSMAIPVFLPVKTVFLALIMGVTGSLLVGFPFLRPAMRIKTSQLLAEGNSIEEDTEKSDLLFFIPGIVLYYFLSIWQAKSILVGSEFVAIFFGSLLALWFFGFVLLWILGKLPTPKLWTLKHAILSITRRKGMSISVVVALGLGSLLMNLLPQLKVGLEQDLEAPRQMRLPNLFLFDVQAEQLEPLQEFVKTEGFDLEQVSPMVRARILKLNGEPFERAATEGRLRTREEDQQAKIRNRGVNLSYRDKLSESETLMTGHEFTGVYDSTKTLPAELSVEARYAEQMGIKIGDKLEFDVQGIEIEGSVVNTRTVKWNSFKPNFFILFQPGILDDAPKTYLAALSNLPKNQIEGFQNKLVASYPNISVIDVGRMMQRIFEMSGKMLWSLQLMAALSMIAGFVILFSIANYQVNRRSWDLNLMKIFGGSRKDLLQFLMIEFGLLGFIGSLFGVGISLLVSFFFANQLFDATFVFSITWPLVTLGAVTGLSMFLVWLVSRKIVLQKPSELLGQKQ